MTGQSWFRESVAELIVWVIGLCESIVCGFRVDIQNKRQEMSSTSHDSHTPHPNPDGSPLLFFFLSSSSLLSFFLLSHLHSSSPSLIFLCPLLLSSPLLISLICCFSHLRKWKTSLGQRESHFMIWLWVLASSWIPEHKQQASDQPSLFALGKRERKRNNSMLCKHESLKGKFT